MANINRDARKESLQLERVSVFHRYEEIVTSMFKDMDLDISFFNSSSLAVETRRTRIDIYYEIDRWHDDHKFRFDMNVAGCGSFDMLEDNDTLDYYLSISKILSNKYFLKQLRSTLESFCRESEEINDQIYAIEKEEYEEELAFKKMEEDKLFEEQCNSLASHKYVAIKKAYQSRFTLRDKPYKLVAFADTKEELANETFDKIVETRKIHI